MRILVAVLVLAVAAAALSQEDRRVSSLPESPHESLFIEGMCAVCHRYFEGVMELHGFVLPIIDSCVRESCHTVERLGRSHPVGINVSQSQVVDSVPENLPLEEGEMVSCGSCHQPHGEWLSRTSNYRGQERAVILVESVGGQQVEVPYFKTYFLRVPGDPEEGFTVLCNSCHSR